jgi:hypothetical protein
MHGLLGILTDDHPAGLETKNAGHVGLFEFKFGGALIITSAFIDRSSPLFSCAL